MDRRTTNKLPHLTRENAALFDDLMGNQTVK